MSGKMLHRKRIINRICAIALLMLLLLSALDGTAFAAGRPEDFPAAEDENADDIFCADSFDGAAMAADPVGTDEEAGLLAADSFDEESVNSGAKNTDEEAGISAGEDFEEAGLSAGEGFEEADISAGEGFEEADISAGEGFEETDTSAGGEYTDPDASAASADEFDDAEADEAFDGDDPSEIVRPSDADEETESGEDPAEETDGEGGEEAAPDEADGDYTGNSAAEATAENEAGLVPASVPLLGAAALGAGAAPVSLETLADSDYSLNYFFNNFNLISFGDTANAVECMGGILIGGSYTHAIYGSPTTFAHEIANVSSCVAGYLEVNNNLDGCNTKHNYNPPADLFVGSSNTVSADGKTLNNYPSAGGDEGFNRYGSVLINDNYIDWTKLKKVFTDASSAWANASTQTIDLTGKDWNYNGTANPLQIAAGSNVTLTGLTQSNAQIYMEITGSSTRNTVINIAGTGNYPLPVVFRMNGQNLTSVNMGGVVNVIFNYPDATGVTTTSDSTFGNVIAPKAYIEKNGGNYNGTLVGNTLRVTAEGHMVKYTGENPPDEPEPPEPPEEEGNCTLLIWKTLDYTKIGKITGSISQLPSDIGFIIEGPKGFYLDIKLNDSRFYNYYDGRELKLENLVPGDYTITEYGGEIDGYRHQVVYHAIPDYNTTTSPVGKPETTNVVTVSEKQSYGWYDIVAKMWIDNVYTEKPREYHFAKTDEEGNLLGGAVLSLLKWTKTGSHWAYINGRRQQVDDYDWKQVGDSWTTEEGKKKTLENLEDGNYILREVSPPEGYEQAEDISFSISSGAMKDSAGKTVQDSTITMVDRKIPFQGVVMPEAGVRDNSPLGWMVMGMVLIAVGILRCRRKV